jgi:serine/threonine-protein kinase
MKRLFTYISIAFVLGILSGYFTYKAISFGRMVKAPDLKGNTLTEAKELLSEKNLVLKVEGEDYDPAVPKGGIIRQSISPDAEVKSRTAIKVFVSKGPVTLLMPLVLGEMLKDAEAIISKNGLKVSNIIHAHSDTVEKGIIIGQRPAPNESTEEAITLIASAGPYDVSYYCPSFEGMLGDDAIALAGSLGLAVETKGAGSLVRGQWPRPNAQIKPGDKLYLRFED